LIRTFRDRATQNAFDGKPERRVPPDVGTTAYRRLRMIEAAHVLEDLLRPPGNRLEALRGDRTGQHSIRINDQWRICFVWRDGDAYDVEIVDYH
jgi:proteic killer suppression protein